MSPPRDFAADPRPPQDVRMRGFSDRSTVAAAWDWLDAQLRRLPGELIELAHAHGRVLADAVCSDVDVPGFDRAMMDGYAVVAADTLGTSAYERIPLRVVGQALAGRAFDGALATGSAVAIMTGAPMPTGADAVLPAELAERDGDRVWAIAPVAPGKNVGRRGEDVSAGSRVLETGRRLRPQDLGLVSSIGVARLPVVRQPRVRIVVTGDELLPAGSRPEGLRIADANGVMLSALVARDGGVPLPTAVTPDDPAAILAAIRDDAQRDRADLVIVSGGSSVGSEDHAPQLVAQHGTLAVHGIAMRPSSPTGLGIVDGRLVFLLPGNPVSCLCGYDFFAGRAVRVMGGRAADWPYRQTEARLCRKLVSTVGRVDYARVRCRDGQVEPLAIGGASVLSSTVRADGFVIVPGDCEGYGESARVTVYLYDDQDRGEQRT